MLEGALRDLAEAREKLGEELVVLRFALWVNLSAGVAYRNLDRVADQDRVLAEASRCAQALLKEPNIHANAVFAVGGYYIARRDYTSLLELCTRLKRNPADWAARWIAYNEGYSLYRLGRIDEAIAAVEAARKRFGTEIVSDVALVMVEKENPGDELKLAAAWSDRILATGSSAPGTHSVYAGAALMSTYARFIFGHRDEGIATARQILATNPKWPYRGDWYQTLFRFYAGQMAADELLKAAGNSNWSRCEAHHAIGLWLLSAGDRDGARTHFEAAAQTHVYCWTECWWSETYLERMKQDPTWPHTIPMKGPPADR